MTQAKGYKGRLVFDYESTFGVDPVSPVGVGLPFNSFDVMAKQTLVDPATITGRRDPVVPISGNVSVDGSLVIPVGVIDIGYWLKATLGAAASSGTNPNYTHVFKTTNVPPSLVLEKGFTDIGQYFKYNGCKVSSFKLPFGGDGELTATVEIMGAKETRGTVEYDSTPDAVVFTRLNQFQGSIKEGGSALTGSVVSGEFTINNNLDGSIYTVGSSGQRGSIPEGLLAANGTLKTLFKDRTLIDKGAAGTESSLEVIFTIDVNTSLSFLFPEIRYELTSPPISGPAGVMVDMSWRAYYQNDAGNSAVVVTLKNSKATY